MLKITFANCRIDIPQLDVMTNMRPTRACAPLTSLEIHTHANLYIFVQVSPKITYVPLENSTHQIEFLQYISNSKEYCFNTKFYLGIMDYVLQVFIEE